MITKTKRVVTCTKCHATCPPNKRRALGWLRMETTYRDGSKRSTYTCFKCLNQKLSTRIYLAARYSRRLELCGYREQLQAIGFDVQARWLNGEHQLDNASEPIGEQGESLVECTTRSGESLSEHEQSERATALRQSFAKDDFDDVSRADLVISFTEPPRSSANRGGRHVEFGIALARGARVIVIGHRENIFHWLPKVEFFTTWEEAKAALKPQPESN